VLIRQREQAAQAAREQAEEERDRADYNLRLASCSSTACHGGHNWTKENWMKETKGSEYTSWILYDKHAKAHWVLFDDAAKLIEKNLRRLGTLKEAHAENDPLCLRCHAMITDNGPQGEFSVRDSWVGCESCHGLADKWLDLHRTPEWIAKSASEKSALGF